MPLSEILNQTVVTTHSVGNTFYFDKVSISLSSENNILADH